MDINKKKLGEAIRFFRTWRGMTQAEVAEKANLSITSIARMERGLQGISMETLNSIAAVFDIPYSFLTLMGSDEIPNGDPHLMKLLSGFQGAIEAIIGADTEAAK